MSTATITRRIWLLLGALCLCGVLPARGQHVEGERTFYPDDPLWEDPDRTDAPVPEPDERSQYYDLLLHSLSDPASYEGPALDINTLGEVPNSSWYTNRHYRQRMSLEALQRGPNTVDGPSSEAPWRVVAGKQEGAALGVQIEDARGDRYLLKFDPPDHPEMSTAAEVISTRLFYALGYNVPENYIAYFKRDQLVPDDGAVYEAPGGETYPLTQAFIDTLLTHAYQYPDGRYRAMASRIIEGEAIGPFSYFGTRADDPNDLYPHEARRVLRGLSVFSAWVKHYDARMANTLDVAVSEGSRTFLRHYLIDFGSTLGSGPSRATPRWIGHEYALEGWPVLARTATLGFGASDWVDIDYPDHHSVGHWEADHFDPETWKTRYPNPAFRRSDAADAFWAARRVMHFTDEELRALVATGDYSDPAAERYVADVLIARRDAIGEAYLEYGGGLDRFRVEDGILHFQDLLAHHGLVDGPPARTVRWHPFDNAASRTGPSFTQAAVEGTSTPVPASDESFLAAVIETEGLGTTRIYLREDAGDYEVVGLERR